MAITNNLFILIFAILPVLMYIFLIYYIIPKNFVSLARGRRYFITGLMSPFIVFLIYFILPNWGTAISNDNFYSYFFYAFIQVGLLEEICKFSIFQWVNSERQSHKYDLPIAIMFHSLMTSLGFAVTENIGYLINLYKNFSNDPMVTELQLNNSMLFLAASRSLTAVVIHMICGVILGYYFSKSIISKFDYSNFIKKLNFKNKFLLNKLYYILLGIIFATAYHGIYDLNLFLEDNNYKILFTTTIISFGLAIGYFMIMDLIRESRIKRFCKLN